MTGLAKTAQSCEVLGSLICTECVGVCTLGVIGCGSSPGSAWLAPLTLERAVSAGGNNDVEMPAVDEVDAKSADYTRISVKRYHAVSGVRLHICQ